jgi:hypothetical protein
MDLVNEFTLTESEFVRTTWQTAVGTTEYVRIFYDHPLRKWFVAESRAWWRGNTGDAFSVQYDTYDAAKAAYLERVSKLIDIISY